MKRWAPLLAWAIALASVIGAAQELRRQREQTLRGLTLATAPRLDVKLSPLGLPDYQAIHQKTAVSGSVDLSPGPNAISVRASALSDYAAWRLTIDQVLLDNPGVTWRIDQLCSGKCSTGEAHKAVLSGTWVSVGVKDPAAQGQATQPILGNPS